MADTQAQLSPPNPGEIANALAEETCAAIAKTDGDTAAVQRILLDLKLQTIRKAASLANHSHQIKNRDEILWRMAHNMRDFSSATLYESRAPLAGLAAAVFLGWILGGLISTLAGFVGLGGEILRPLFICLLLWLGDWLSSNPRARKILLTVLGLGALTRFAGMAAAGLLRFTGIGGFRQLVFGGMAKPNIFKGFWLMAGAFFIFIFLAKKASGLNIPAFKNSLVAQIEGCLREYVQPLNTLGEKDAEIRALAGESDVSPLLCPKKDCQLAAAVISILDSLAADEKNFLTGKLTEAGFSVSSANDDGWLVWNEKRDGRLYEAIGLARDGDRCRILSRPYEKDGKTVKGHVQRMD